MYQAHRRRSALVLVVVALAFTAIAVRATDASGEQQSDATRGLVREGLVRDEAGPCSGSFRLAGVTGRAACTHGPDPAPSGIDVTRRRTTSELVAATNEGSTAASASSVPCYGDGVSGKRVQAVYAYAEDKVSRAGTVVDLIAGWAGTIDGIFRDSAAKTGGVRHVRWVTSEGCKLSVTVVRLSAAGDDSFSTTVSELRAAGLDRSDRKYLVWVDASRYCGISEFWTDDTAGSTNASETRGGYARVDNGCWGFGNSVEAHELMHMIGGVQDSAPHSTGGGHCTDEYDRMCYTDSQTVTLTYPCADTQERLFDCGNDDYFHTAPSAGSYLATRWNSAMSGFLERAEPGQEPPPETWAVTTASTTWSGSLSRRTTSASYGVNMANGTVDAVLTFSKAKSLTLTIKRADGTVVATRTGASGLELSAGVLSGAHSLIVSGASSASFKLSVTYPTTA